MMRVSGGSFSGWYGLGLDVYGKDKTILLPNMFVGEMSKYYLGSFAEALQEVVSDTNFNDEGVAGKCRVRIAFGSYGESYLSEGMRFWKQRAWFDDGGDGICVVDLNKGGLLNVVFPVEAIEELLSLIWDVID